MKLFALIRRSEEKQVKPESCTLQEAFGQDPTEGLTLDLPLILLGDLLVGVNDYSEEHAWQEDLEDEHARVVEEGGQYSVMGFKSLVGELGDANEEEEVEDDGVPKGPKVC